MARGINKVILIGNLGKDPEVRYMPSGGAVANFSIATSESWKDKQTGEMQERTEWHNVTAFGRLGEISGEYLRKGSKVYVEGRIQTDKYQAKDGSDRYSTKIIINEMQMLDSRSSANTDTSFPSQPANNNAPASSNNAAAVDAPFDDDIPF